MPGGVRLPNAVQTDLLHSGNLYDWLERTMGRRQYKMYFYAQLLLVFAVLVGYGYARKSSFFLITKAGDQVLLRNYGDVYIFKNFDKATNTIGNEVTIRGPDDVSKMALQKVHVKSPTIADALDLTKSDAVTAPKNDPKQEPKPDKKEDKKAEPKTPQTKITNPIVTAPKNIPNQDRPKEDKKTEPKKETKPPTTTPAKLHTSVQLTPVYRNTSDAPSVRPYGSVSYTSWTNQILKSSFGRFRCSFWRATSKSAPTVQGFTTALIT
jgi:outer membrane biosynthesis protein TonB